MASINITLRNKEDRNQECPVILRITKNRKSKMISLKMKCKRKDWDFKKNEFKRSYPNAAQRNMILLRQQEKALKIIDEYTLDNIDFTLDQFENKFKGKSPKSITVSDFWIEKIDDLIVAGRIGNAVAHKGVYNSFFSFYKKKTIVFKEITPVLLDKYETYLRSVNNSDGGIAFKMREIRALYNSAINSGFVDPKYYPFKTYKISKLKGKSIKKAISREQMRLMESIDTQLYPDLIDAKNYLIFSYYTGGMNFIDMLKLKWQNIDENRIHYIRSKTKGNFSIAILEPVKKVLEYYKNQNRATEYVFPILLKEGLTPIQIENRKKKTLKKFNRDLKKIAEIQGVKQTVTSYTIRHSFATNLKYAGVATDIISDAMGHANVEITNTYLKAYSHDIIDDGMKKLLEEPLETYKKAA